MKIDVRRVPLPDFGVPEEIPAIPRSEYESRCASLYAHAGSDWVAIYGDREHLANLTFLTSFDPRFEEALVLLGPSDRRVLVVGNEGLIHAQVAGLPVEVVLYQPFSLMGQPRDTSPPLPDLLRGAGVSTGDSVAIVGWKYLEPGEAGDPDDGGVPSFVPAFLPRAFAIVTGELPQDVTALMMHPTDGLRAHNSAAQVARFEWGAARSSAAVLRVVRATKPGMSELETLSAMGYAGEPQSCHPILASSDASGPLNGLRSPSARRIAEGDAISCGVGYWGGLTCRAGLVTGEPDEAFISEVVRPYFAAIATWWSTVSIGVPGGDIDAAVNDALSSHGGTFRPLLNPGHLISYEEWVHSPIRPGSAEPLASGMVLQCDIIPDDLGFGRALNCEDTAALADELLRAALARDFPDLWARIESRRAFMRDALGITIRPEVLPLSIAPAYLPPFWLANDLVCVVTR
jgi:hypothetical protein